MPTPGSHKVDPACAICSAPADCECGCEAHALEVAINQAEDRYLKPTFVDVRSWVRRRARDYILAYFHIISEPCKDAYSEHLDTIKATCYAQYHCPPTPAHFRRAEAEYRCNIDRAWSLAVKRYPEVLDYFYSLVHVSLPDDDDPAVRRPPLDRLADLEHAERRALVPRYDAPQEPKFPVPAVPPGSAAARAHAARWHPGQPTPPASPHHGAHGWGPF
ncbi:hypothetical protein PWT90_07723 [Aphanocladium album]|nr:hypothetical protein PWT90_07723 [Aphanocladium album]